MKKLKVFVIFAGVFLLCSQAHAVQPFEARTAWVGGQYWVDGSTGNTVEVTRGEDRMNSLLIINDCPTQTIYVNPNGAATSDSTVTAYYDKMMRWNTAQPASATTSDFKLEPGDWLIEDPWTASRVEVTGSTGVLTEGWVRILITYAD